MLSVDLTTGLAAALLVYVGWLERRRPSRWTGRLLVLLLLSPGLRYVSTLFTFPIRLQLSAWAGALLRLAGVEVQTEGNVLIKNGSAGVPVEMAVDPACMGLQMTGVSLLVALFLLIWHERQAQKAIPVACILAYGLLGFGLTIGSNLFRIVLLVLFEAMPGTVAHEAIGLVCVAAYAWLPIAGLARGLVMWVGRPTSPAVVRPSAAGWRVGWGLVILAGGLSIMAFAARPTPPQVDLCRYRHVWYAKAGDYQCRPVANGFVQLTRPGKLIYLKPQPDWFSADHSPTACWRGSGYDLRRVRETRLDGHPAYVGELRKQGQTLYTAWWFSNGQTTTISQLTLRGRMLRGETGFALVNVTTSVPFNQ